MARREFQLIDGSAKKFWAVEVEGTTQKVHYGRIGTTGQAQAKEFASAAEAAKATEKLIAEKVKKGYAEVASGAGSSAMPTPIARVKKPKQEAEEPSEPNEKPAQEAAPVAAAVVNAAVARRIDLEPEDWEKAEWPRTWRQKVRPQPQPFDRKRCLQVLADIQLTTYHYWPHNWVKQIPESMSGEEAHFWLQVHARLGASHAVSMKPADFADAVADLAVKETLAFQEAVDTLSALGMDGDYTLVRPLAFLVSPREIVSLALHEWKNRWGHNRLGEPLAKVFATHVLPYLSEAEKREIEDQIRPMVPPGTWENTPVPCRLAAYLGMHDEVNCGAASVQYHEQFGRSPDSKLIAFSHGKPEAVEAFGRRVKLKFSEPEEIRRWLAVTKFSGLDLVRDSILDADSAYDYSSGSIERYSTKEQAARLTEELARVKAPEAAPVMLELKLGSKAPHVARQWLDENVGCAVAGLIPVAAGRGKLAEAALEYLREAKKKGHEALIRECLAATPDAADSIRRNVLDFAEKEYAVHDAASLPADLKAALEVKSKKKAPAWTAPASLPPIVVAGKKLGNAHAAAVVEALSRSTLEKPDPLIPILKQHAEAPSLDDFAWRLFQLWQGESSPSKEKWAMGAIGLIGGDASALKLTPLVRNWPGESQHQRAVFGLECLRTIGSDTALMQLNGIAQKLKFKGLKEKAAQAMEAIAKDKGLTRAQLEDRIVPDCDLDERGTRVFDFGPRQFRFVLGPEMKPMIKDPDGKVKTDLPKPGAKDDSATADAAVAEWKLLKKQIKEVATIQALRLEQAMVTGRRWPIADFESLLVKHPLMTNLVRLLLWGGHDKAGKLATTFRVTEDQSYANVKDDACTLAGLEVVGIVHPLHLSAEQQSTWGEVFSDYELIPPFRQLGRRIVRPEPEELNASEIVRFKGIAIPAPTLVYGLEKLGWVRGTGMDAGCFDEHSKPFPAANITAVVHYEGTVGFGYIDPNESLKIDNCYFVDGIRPPSGYADKEKSIPLKDVDPVAISEVLTDLSALAAKGKQS